MISFNSRKSDIHPVFCPLSIGEGFGRMPGILITPACSSHDHFFPDILCGDDDDVPFDAVYSLYWNQI